MQGCENLIRFRILETSKALVRQLFDKHGRGLTYPPTTTTLSSPCDLHLTFGIRLPPLIADSSPLTYTPPFISMTSNLFKASGAGESSTSPVKTLKQAKIPQLVSKWILDTCSPPCH